MCAKFHQHIVLILISHRLCRAKGINIMILKQVIRYTNADALEATWVDENDVVVKCQAYSNGQMNMLRADLGADALKYKALIDEVAATYVPPLPPTPAEVAAKVKAETLALIDSLERQYMMPRITREFILTAVKREVAALGADPKLNKGYVALKAFDDQISALRAKL